MSKKAETPKKIEEEPKEATEEETKPEKAAKKEKKKKQEKGIFALYKVENDKAIRLRPTCERCGTGYFMADHGDRHTCGHCGFSRYKHAKDEHV